MTPRELFIRRIETNIEYLELRIYPGPDYSSDRMWVSIQFREGLRTLEIFGCSKWEVSHRGAYEAFRRIKAAAEDGLLDEELREFYSLSPYFSR